MEGNGNCTVEQGPGCRTTDMYFFNKRGNVIEPGSTALHRPLTSDTVQGLSRLMEPLLGGGCVCSLETRLGVVGEGAPT